MKKDVNEEKLFKFVKEARFMNKTKLFKIRAYIYCICLDNLEVVLVLASFELFWLLLVSFLLL